MTNNRTHSTNIERHTRDENRGITLLLVILVGGMVLVTTLSIAEYAQRLVTTLQVRGDAVQELYFAESTFECVKYWLRRDYRHFTNTTFQGGPEDPQTGAAATASCNGHNVSSSYDSGSQTGTFVLPLIRGMTDGPSVMVEVERYDDASDLFEGDIRVYSRSNTASGLRTTERFHQYYYFILYGSDIVFVIDRSGSIQVDPVLNPNRTVRSHNLDQWNRLLYAVNDAIMTLGFRIPKPHIGLLTFGTDVNDTGINTGSGLTIAQSLTDVSTDLISPGPSCANPTEIDDCDIETGSPQFVHTDIAATNLSLGLSVAGAQLMRKLYPLNGGFESAAVGGNFNGLPNNNSSGDRDDRYYPDVIIVVTDGAPNGIMTHVGGEYPRADVYDFPDTNLSLPYDLSVFEVPMVWHDYQPGEPKIFRVPTFGRGDYILDYPTSSAGWHVDFAGYDPNLPGRRDYVSGDEYSSCRDGGGPTPSSIFSGSPLATNRSPHMAMCNGSLIAHALKDADRSGTENDSRGTNEQDMADIYIMGIFVTNDPIGTVIPEEEYSEIGGSNFNEGAHWLKHYVASQKKNRDGTPEGYYFETINDYPELKETLLYMFEQLALDRAR